MHVADAGRALAHLLASDVKGAVNVASGRAVSIAAIAGIAARLAGRPDLLALDARASSEPSAILADTTRLLASGFKPSIALEDGLAELWSAAAVRQRRPITIMLRGSIVPAVATNRGPPRKRCWPERRTTRRR